MFVRRSVSRKLILAPEPIPYRFRVFVPRGPVDGLSVTPTRGSFVPCGRNRSFERIMTSHYFRRSIDRFTGRNRDRVHPSVVHHSVRRLGAVPIESRSAETSSHRVDCGYETQDQQVTVSIPLCIVLHSVRFGSRDFVLLLKNIKKKKTRPIITHPQ